MKQLEKIKTDLIKQMDKSETWAVHKYSHKLVDCQEIYCSKCLFYEGIHKSCEQNKIEWLDSEYKEPKEFLEKEILYIDLNDKIKWIAKNTNGMIYGYDQKPIYDKEYQVWRAPTFSTTIINISKACSLPFAAIKCDDLEPTSREEILGE